MPTKARDVVYLPADLAGLMHRNKLSYRLLADILTRNRAKNYGSKPITHQTLKNWATGETEPGIYTWLAVEAILRKEFPHNARSRSKSVA